MKRLQHGMLLDAKSVMDNALPDLQQLIDLVHPKMQPEAITLLESFEDTLCAADVSAMYEGGWRSWG